ncbi:MAG: helix-turn-helix domain-containing protein [Actinomycetota bacterium]|nr:helix-turn-helix domain-containing protein [Actinomycetota bacterium]
MPSHRDPPLTVDEIISTTLALTADVGIEALTMRAVATALDVTATALYHHIGSKDALVGLVLDAVVAGVATPATGLAWDQWLIAYHDGLWNRLQAHRGMARHLLEHPSTPAGAAIRNTTVDMLVASGFTERDALLAAATFHTYLLGRLAVDAFPDEIARPHEPSWRSHGLGAADYTAHGLKVVIAGLHALYGAPAARQ